MFASLFKKKPAPPTTGLAGHTQPTGPTEPTEPTDTTQPTEPTGQQLQAVEYEEEQSKRSVPLYFMPKVCGKTFSPEEWSIQDFQVGRHIGRGKYGHVYLARERKTKHVVALKVLSKRQLVNSEVVYQLRREIEIHSHLKHDNVLQMYGFFFDSKRIYIIMEYAPGGELYAILQSRGKFEESRSSLYTAQIISAMQHIHGLDIIHRDLKPENILVFDDQTIKLSDFGWAVHTSRTRKTFCGTIDYICPEIITRHPYDAKLDMWTIGVLAYELSAGFAPFSAENRGETSKKIRNLDYRLPTHFSPELKDFVSRLLLGEPEKRMSELQALSHPWIAAHRK